MEIEFENSVQWLSFFCHLPDIKIASRNNCVCINWRHSLDLEVLKIKLPRTICYLYPVPGRRLLQCSYSYCWRLDRFVLSFFNALFFSWCTSRTITPQRYVLPFWFSLKAIFFIYHMLHVKKESIKLSGLHRSSVCLRRGLQENLVKSGVWKFGEESNLWPRDILYFWWW